jgi:serine phosphatase RsbU (regulator of sigma subunit)
VRFFAGIPLADEEGVVLGAFCLCDTAPRRLDAAQRATLTELARWARRDLVDSEEMARARRAQESLLPTAPPQVPGYELAAVCVPTKSVGGDFYDFGTAPERLNVSLVDVMGKGTAAALVAATVRALLRASMGEVALGLGGRSPQALTRPIRGGVAGVVADIDRLVSADLARTATLVTGFFCDLVPQTGIVRYVDAGHGLAVLLRRDGGATWLRSADLPIGVELRGQWSDQEDVLHPGDTLLCVSDGLLDLIGGTEQALGSLAAMARSHSTAADLIGAIRRLTEVGVAVDDVTAVAVRREETP